VLVPAPQCGRQRRWVRRRVRFALHSRGEATHADAASAGALGASCGGRDRHDRYGERFAEVMELVEEVAFRRLDSRLAQLLIRRGPVLHETHQRLADELGSVREIVSRLLRGFEKRGWVRIEREKVTVLDPKGLSEIAKP